MNYGKYIIKEIMGHEVAILFNPLINHCDIGTCKESRGETVSAGFFIAFAEPSEQDNKDIGVEVFGKSETLKLESRPEDEKLVKQVLRKG